MKMVCCGRWTQPSKPSILANNQTRRSGWKTLLRKNEDNVLEDFGYNGYYWSFLVWREQLSPNYRNETVTSTYWKKKFYHASKVAAIFQDCGLCKMEPAHIELTESCVGYPVNFRTVYSVAIRRGGGPRKVRVFIPLTFMCGVLW